MYYNKKYMGEKKKDTKRVLVVASTFPASDTSPVPAFVKEQVQALKRAYPHLELSVLAPHDARSHTKNFTQHADYNEYRFHYAWPHGLEKLAGRGIMPQLKQNPAYYLLVPALFIAEFFALFRLARKIQPDIIYAHWFMPQAITSVFVSRLTRIPYTFTTHSSDMQVMKKLPLARSLMNFAMKHVLKWTLISEKTLAKTKPLFSDEEWQQYEKKMKMIPMGVHVKEYADTTPAEPQLPHLIELPKEQKIVFFIGRLAEIKGIHQLIAAFAKLNRRDYMLVIAGEGPEQRNLKQLTKQHHLQDQIRFVGHVSKNDKKYLYQRADVMVVPSIKDSRGHTEGMPVVLLEGLASGKVIIASDVSGGELVIEHGVNGFLYPYHSLDELAQQLEVALELSDSKKQAIALASQERALEYDWEVIAQKHYDFLLSDE